MVHLISDKLVELVEEHSSDIIKRWSKRLLSDPTTSTYSEQHLNVVQKKAADVLENLSKWVSYDTQKEEIGRMFAKEGMELFHMGIPLCEAHRAMVTLRRTLWLFVVNESQFDSAMELHQLKELSDRVILFFDRANYYLLRGYSEEMNKKLKELTNISQEDADKIFFDRSFYNK